MKPIAAPRLFVLALLLAAAIVGIDQYSKELFIKALAGQPPYEVTSWFNLVMVWNTGISFGMLAEHRQPLLLAAGASVILLILLIWLARNDSKPVALALGAIIGGAASNIIDRLRFGAVADFFDVHLGGYHWPAFNIADGVIFIGVVVLCLHGMLAPHKESTP